MALIKKTVLFFVGILISSALYAGIPSVPSKCNLAKKNFCSTGDVVRVSGRKAIKVVIAAAFNKSDYRSAQELVDHYFDFAKWPDYTANSDNIWMNYSRAQFVRVDGVERKRHQVKYKIKAPIIGKLKVEDLVEYDESPVAGALVSATFRSHPSFASQRDGIKENWGQIHVLDRNGKYVVVFENFVVPDISFGLGLATSYVERAMKDVFEGMFGL